MCKDPSIYAVQGHAEGSQGPLRGEEAQGDLLAVLHALAGPPAAAEILRVMSTDRSIAAIYERLGERQKLEGTIPRWGDAVVWSELHHSESYRMDWD